MFCNFLKASNAVTAMAYAEVLRRDLGSGIIDAAIQEEGGGYFVRVDPIG